MDTSTVLARVTKVAANELGVDEAGIGPESRFVEDMNADSLDLVELVMAIEEEFEPELRAAGIKDGITDQEAEKLAKVQDVVDFIAQKADLG